MKLPTINGLDTRMVIQRTDPQVAAIIITIYHRGTADLWEGALQN